ncbi:MAG: hypothetical protein V3T72_20455 [Thermoanaerobaculia bacterium]
MTTESPETRPALSRSRRWLRRLLVAAVAVIVAYGLLFIALKSKLRSIERDVAARGESLDFADIIPPELDRATPNASDRLEAMALIAEGQEAVYLPRGKAPADLEELQQRLREITWERTAIGDADLELFRRTVERHRLVLEVFDASRSISAARDKTNYDALPAAVIIPNLLPRLRLAMLVRARAHTAIADARFDDAWLDAAGILRLASWVGGEMPTLISALVARAITRQGTELVRCLAEVSPPTSEQRRMLVEEADRIEPLELINSALMAERSFVYSTLVDPRAPRDIDLTDLSVEPPWRNVLLMRPWLWINAALYVGPATSIFEACIRPSYQHEEDLAGRIDELKPSTWALPPQEFFYDCSDVSHKRDDWVAILDLMELGLRLEAARDGEGEVPQSLAALGGELPLDPFSNEPYRYRRKNGGYVLYSVSANRVDDGGVPTPLTEDKTPDLGRGDIVWEVSLHSEGRPG